MIASFAFRSLRRTRSSEDFTEDSVVVIVLFVLSSFFVKRSVGEQEISNVKKEKIKKEKTGLLKSDEM
ncbi:MAG: hypothetical protein P8Y18_09045 [Candidatus Bathyarchaeota archaeon]